MKTCKTCRETKNLSEFYKGVQYYQSECKKCSIIRSSEYRKKNPDKKYGYTKNWRERNHNSWKVKSGQILENMVARSKKKGFHAPEFSRLEIEAIIMDGKCSKTGIKFEFDQSTFSKSPWTPVPDRIDSSKGYSKDNVQWVCHMYNSMKQEYTESEVMTFMKAYYYHNPIRKVIFKELI